MAIQPNPNNGNFDLLLNLERNEKVKVSIKNVIWQEVFSYDAGEVEEILNLQVSIKTQASGVYFVEIEIGDNVLVESLLRNS